MGTLRVHGGWENATQSVEEMFQRKPLEQEKKIKN